MTLIECKEAFAAAHPKAVDFYETDFYALQPAISDAAAAFGYRLAGFRLKRAVFTTKAAPIQQEEVA
jgi:hypothetical protein